MTDASGRIPSFLITVATLFVPSGERDFVRGDLHEWYRHLRSETGRGRASVRLLWELFSVQIRFAHPIHHTFRRMPEVTVLGLTMRFLGELRQDLRYQARRFFKNPIAALGSTLIIATAIGGVLVVLSVFGTLLWPPSGIAAPADILVLERVFPSGSSANLPSNQARVVRDIVGEGVTVYSARVVSIRSDDVTHRRLANVVSDQFFSMMGAFPQVGRGFEGRPAGGNEMVLSHEFWQQTFAGRDVLGTVLFVNRVPFTVVGVARAGFNGPAGNRPPAFWLSSEDIIGEQETFGGVVRLMVSRSAPSIPAPEVLDAEIGLTHPEAAARFSFRWTPLDQAMGAGGGERQFVMQTLTVAGIFAGLVLFVACANVANAFVADGLRRRNEFAMRAAIGATRGRLIRQSMTEAVTISLLAAVGGVAAAMWSLSVLPNWLPTPYDGAQLQFVIRTFDLAIALFLALLVAILSGLVPSLRTSKPRDQRVIGSGKHGFFRQNESLVVGQVALSVAVTILAMLMVGRISRLHDTALGYAEENRWAFSLQFDETHDQASRLQVVNRLFERTRRQVGTARIGAMSYPPFAAFSPYTPVSLSGNADTSMVVSTIAVDDGYFDVMEVPFRSGRSFQPTPSAQTEIVISQSVSDSLWPGGSGMGEVIYIRGATEPSIVVGVIEDGTYGSGRVLPMIFTDIRRAVPVRLDVVWYDRAGGDVAAELGRILGTVDRELAMPVPYPVVEWFERAWVLERALGDVSRVLSFLALTISAFGLFAFFSQTVADGVREIGIRRALGATGKIVTLNLWMRAMTVATVGLVLGGGLSLAAGKVLAGYVGALGSVDIVVWTQVALGVLTIASVSTLIPIRQANAVDPLAVIRDE